MVLLCWGVFPIYPGPSRQLLRSEHEVRLRIFDLCFYGLPTQHHRGQWEGV